MMTVSVNLLALSRVSTFQFISDILAGIQQWLDSKKNKRRSVVLFGKRAGPKIMQRISTECRKLLNLGILFAEHFIHEIHEAYMYLKNTCIDYIVWKYAINVFHV